MKSLKNKKCKVCGKPAEIWLPNENDDEEPYCMRCANDATEIVFEVPDEDDEE